MRIGQLAKGVLIAALPAEPRLGGELRAVNETVSENPACDVIIDFSRVEVLASSSLASLLLLRDRLNGLGRRLVFYNVGPATRCIFIRLALDGVFCFADDKSAALAAIRGPA
ncbi:MAG: STAS domain-containing protein [Planctomycetota bacterium]|jgi:anti-anti-sigma regulatory factor